MDEKDRAAHGVDPKTVGSDPTTAVADPIEAMVEKIKTEGSKAHAAFYAWAKQDRQRVENDVPNTPEHLLAGARALMAFGQSRVQSIADLKKVMAMARQLHMAAAKEYQRVQSEGGDVSAVSERAAHLAEKIQELGGTLMYIEHELQHLGGTFDVLAAKFWELYPARAENGALIHTLPMN